MKLTFLGTGTSQGVPMIACDCEVCRSKDARNQRFRTSALIEDGDFTILIDASPDLRSQSLRAGLSNLDAVLFTHIHSDHLLGIDDLRRFCMEKRLPGFGSKQTLERIGVLFPYAIKDNGSRHPYTRLELHEITAPFDLGPFRVVPYTLPHGSVNTDGFIFEKKGRRLLAYFTDCKDVPAEARAAAKGADVLVLDALRFASHPTHLSISESIEIAKEIGAKATYFVHLTHDVEHEKHGQDLPKGISFAYDQLSVEI